MNYEFNLLHRVGVVAKRQSAAGGGDSSARRGRQYPFGPNGSRGKKQKRRITNRFQQKAALF